MSRRGYTLVELLVVTALVAVVAGLTLPAVLAARRGADRVGCQNNLKQLGVAYQAYFSDYDRMPGRPWTWGLLPYLDAGGAAARPPGDLETVSVAVFRCPAGGGDDGWRPLATGNYAQNAFLGDRTLADIRAHYGGLSHVVLCVEDRSGRLGPWVLGPEATAVNLENDPPHGRGGHVLFGDGRVEFLADAASVSGILQDGTGR